MHELSIAEALVDQVVAVAYDNQLKKVDEVEIEVGVLRAVLDEVMQEAFRSVIKDTVVQGARLKLIEIKAVAECLTCAKKFEPEIDNFLCPACMVANVKILAGNNIILKSVVEYRE